jgi:protein subunit release factor A
MWSELARAANRMAFEYPLAVRRMIDASDIETQVYRSDDPGTVDSSVRLGHEPTGIVVESSEHDTQQAIGTLRCASLSARSAKRATPPLCPRESAAGLAFSANPS